MHFGDPLQFSFFIAGGIFGFMQGLAPTIVSELFGLTNFASNYALLTTMFIFSSFSIANGLMSWNYDLFSNHHHPSQCHGSRCHKLGFYICAGLCTFACVLSIILTIRRKEFYHMMHKYALLLIHLWCLRTAFLLIMIDPSDRLWIWSCSSLIPPCDTCVCVGRPL